MSKKSNYLENALMFKEYGIGDEYTESINDGVNDKQTLNIKFATLDEDGTTVEDLIAVAIGKLSMELPRHETALAIEKLDEALLWLHYRTVDRTRRHVEGTKEE